MLFTGQAASITFMIGRGREESGNVWRVFTHSIARKKEDAQCKGSFDRTCVLHLRTWNSGKGEKRKRESEREREERGK